MAAKHYDVKTFTSTDSIGYLLKMSHSVMHDSAAAAFAGHDLSFMQWIVLMKLRENASLTASELCRDMHHDNGALTRMLDQLEERDYVQRERSEADRRVVRLQLTPAGRRKVTELMPLVVDRLNAALTEFSKAEFAELTRLLNKLIGGVKTSEETAAGRAS
ncbi:MAG TPA: MarR family transcriptional regulator [Steroidobacteraceae bacterium]|jgi:DNA-binding MarR family transcriptional regulator